MADVRTAPGRPRSAKANTAILKAAIAEIRAVGYDAAAMDAIAARAGVGKATVYRRWSSKEELVVDALKDIMLSGTVPDTGDTRADLTSVMMAGLHMYEDPATLKLLSALVATFARSERIAEAGRNGFIATRRKTVRQVLINGVARGTLRRDTDLEFALDLLQAPFAYRALITGAPVNAALVKNVVDCVMTTFAPPPQATRGQRK